MLFLGKSLMLRKISYLNYIGYDILSTLSTKFAWQIQLIMTYNYIIMARAKSKETKGL